MGNIKGNGKKKLKSSSYITKSSSAMAISSKYLRNTKNKVDNNKMCKRRVHKWHIEETFDWMDESCPKCKWNKNGTVNRWNRNCKFCVSIYMYGSDDEYNYIPNDEE